MKLIYTIIKGTLNGENKFCELPFALVFEENGVYILETFLREGFFEKNDFSSGFNLMGITDNGFEIEIKDLTFTFYKDTNCKAKFICRNYVKLTDKETELPKNPDKKEDAILFIEIEGLNIKFADRTDIKKYRTYGEIDKFTVNFDHTSCKLYIQIEGYKENYFHLVFSKSQTNNLIQIDFTKTSGYGRLTFKHYQVFKKQFIDFLSFINGGNVNIRRELTGSFYKGSGMDSHIVYNYSFTKIETSNTSDYIPINEHHSYSADIFQEAFRYCFDSFYHNDLNLNFSSIITSINTAYSTTGIHQAYSILINALEKLSTNFQRSLNVFDEMLIDKSIWEETIKQTLFKELRSFKSLLDASNKNAYNIFKSKIGGLNRRENSTVQKLYDLLIYGCIPINKNVENLIEQERHTAVHNGEFGKNMNEILINYQKLDHILRDIILNIIDYRSYKNIIYEYAKIDELKKANPERKREVKTYYCSQPLRT